MLVTPVVDLAARILVDATVKGTVLLVAAGLATLLFRRSSAAMRHRVWSLTMLGLMLLPVLSGLLPAWQLPILPSPPNVPSDPQPGVAHHDIATPLPMIAPAAAEPNEKPIASQSTSPLIPLPEPVVEEAAASLKSAPPSLLFLPSLLIVWSLGMTTSLAGVAIGLWQARQLSRGSQVLNEEPWRQLVQALQGRLGLRRDVELRESAQSIVPLTWGFWQPKVLLPQQARTWADSMRRAVLLHELAHVQRRDVAYQLLGRLACAVYWFHPLAWLGLNQMRHEREQACDDAVIHTGERATDYATQLLEVAQLYHRPGGLSLAVEMSRGGGLEQRIRALFDVARSHSPLSLRVAMTVFFVMTTAVCGLAVIKPVAREAVAGDENKTTNTNSFLIKLPKEITVELVGVGKSNAKNADVCWRPDGGAMNDSSDLPSPFSPRVENTSHDLFLRISGRKNSQQIGYANPGMRQWHTIPENDVLHRVAILSKENAFTLQIGITDEEWGPWQKVSTQGDLVGEPAIPPSHEFVYEEITPVHIEQRGNETGICLSNIQDKNLASLDIRAIDQEGKEQRRYAVSLWGDEDPAHMELFKLPLDNIDHFEYRLLPYRYWVTFENISLNAGKKTNVGTSVRKVDLQGLLQPVEAENDLHSSTPRRPENGDEQVLKFTEEYRLELSPKKAQGSQWFFIDFDRMRTVTPPFPVNLDPQKLPFVVLQPTEAELTEWLTDTGVDLIVRSETPVPPDKSGQIKQAIQIRSFRTLLQNLSRGLKQRTDSSWIWQASASDVVELFARKNESIMVSGLVPNSSSLVPTSQTREYKAFRTAENLLGVYLLEQPYPKQNDLSLRVAYVQGATNPLQDHQFRDGDFLDGKLGPADPNSFHDKNHRAEKNPNYQSVTYRQPQLAAKIPEDSWSKPFNGLRMALVSPNHVSPEKNEPTINLVPRKLTATSDETLNIQFLFENTSEKNLELSGFINVGNGWIECVDQQGKQISVKQVPLLVYGVRDHWHLLPGERQVVAIDPIRLKSFIPVNGPLQFGHFLDVPPGEYTLRFVFKSQEDSIPAWEWTGTLSDDLQPILTAPANNGPLLDTAQDQRSDTRRGRWTGALSADLQLILTAPANDGPLSDTDEDR